jgi:hypothetical protein
MVAPQRDGEIRPTLAIGTSRSPTHDNGTKDMGQHPSAPEIAESAAYIDDVGYPPQQAFLPMDSVPDSNGLDEWTQLFLNQVFAAHGSAGASVNSQEIPHAGPSSHNLIPSQPHYQHQHTSQHPPNPFLHTLRETVSPKSPVSNRRVGKFRIPYFR